MNLFRSTSFLIAILCLGMTSAQEDQKYSVSTINPLLLINANAVIRTDDVQVTIEDYDDVLIEENRIVTVLNESGMGDVRAYQLYNDNVSIKNLKVLVFDSDGNEIYKVRERNFNDESAVPSGTLYSDNRRKYLSYTPREYPVTFHFTSKVKLKTTAFLPVWTPLNYYYASTEYSSFKVINESDEVVNFKESNLENYSIEKLGELHYEATNMMAIKPEAYAPEFTTFGPQVKIALERFDMVGVEGVNTGWKEFGKWMNDHLLNDVGEVEEYVKAEVLALTKDAQTDEEKARIIYDYMQKRSRYISVQVGIGGWRPIEATEVHNKAYGDCKGLSNYTRALMEVVGVKANYAVIYGGSSIKNIDSEFSSTEGNHVVLVLPQLDGKEDVWLECTSKTNPFGYIAGFTDDRDALVITEEGGKIVHTTVYPTEQNTQDTQADITIFSDGSAKGDVEIVSRGWQYKFKDHISNLNAKDAAQFYQRQWSDLNGLEIVDNAYNNDKREVSFTENVSVKVKKFASKAGNLLLYNPRVFNHNSSEIPDYEHRKYSFEMQHGYIDRDQYNISLQEGLVVDALPDSVLIETKFGTYESKAELMEDGSVKVYRYLKINKGQYQKEDYKVYQEFREAIAKADKRKAVIKIL